MPQSPVCGNANETVRYWLLVSKRLREWMYLCIWSSCRERVSENGGCVKELNGKGERTLED